MKQIVYFLKQFGIYTHKLKIKQTFKSKIYYLVKNKNSRIAL